MSGPEEDIAGIPLWQDCTDELQAESSPGEEEEAFVDPLAEPAHPSRFPFNKDLNSRISVWIGKSWMVDADAIVNATEEYYSDKRGLSEYVFRQAGPLLEQEVTQRAMEANPSNNPVGCRTGDAIITNAYNLRCSKVIHTVGPRYNEKYRTAAENMLHSCYRTCMSTLAENKLRSIVFTPIHSERKNYSVEDGCPIAIRTVRRWLERYPGKVDRVVFSMPTQHDYDVYFEQMRLYFPRNAKEEQRALTLLPEDTGNEIGETVCPERSIRVAIAPGDTTVDTNSSLHGSSVKGTKTPAFANSAVVDTLGALDTKAVAAPQSTFGRVSVISGASPVNAIDAAGFCTMQADVDKNRPPSTQAELDQAIIYQRYLTRAQKESFHEVEGLKVLFKCGLDVAGRQVIAFVGSRVPDGFSYDNLLLYFIKLVDPICDKDYSLVYFHTKIRNKPQFSWLRRAYRLLPPNYKKNLKAVYVVHPTVWLNLAIAFVKPFVHERFWQKVLMMNDMRQLYSYVPPDSITIPEEIVQYNTSLHGTGPIRTSGSHKQDDFL
eukprot:NODE_1337_length_1775_cov_178.368644_g1270_i0.p1 GENE.NODE_1337_length_1775_cov_178.368644_g1270_i0~~NODE_1337_length_1775_cov_178.368644_g1270_i0.p1  ORF type:complete len:565 (+),score=76.04 NODE_1337_length_1775_cov_178.368644_g1270_i0:58-1695(+)